MGVQFTIAGVRTDWEDEDSYLSVTGSNACELLAHLGLEPSEMGSVRARDLRQRCARALALPAVASDSGRPARSEDRLVWCGRPEGYLEMRLRALDALAERAGELGMIRWA